MQIVFKVVTGTVLNKERKGNKAEEAGPNEVKEGVI